MVVDARIIRVGTVVGLLDELHEEDIVFIYLLVF
jgi:hypothetical protein